MGRTCLNNGDSGTSLLNVSLRVDRLLHLSVRMGHVVSLAITVVIFSLIPQGTFA